MIKLTILLISFWNYDDPRWIDWCLNAPNEQKPWRILYEIEKYKSSKGNENYQRWVTNVKDHFYDYLHWQEPSNWTGIQEINPPDQWVSGQMASVLWQLRLFNPEEPMPPFCKKMW